jgi:hypothetical protein
MAPNSSVRTIDLSADDALVLFEWVSRVTDDERLTEDSELVCPYRRFGARDACCRRTTA